MGIDKDAFHSGTFRDKGGGLCARDCSPVIGVVRFRTLSTGYKRFVAVQPICDVRLAAYALWQKDCVQDG